MERLLVDTQVLKSKFKESFFIGGISFAAPFWGPCSGGYHKAIEKEQTLVCEGAREKGVEIRCRILPGHEVEAIIAYAQKGGFDTLLLGRKGRSAILRTQSGSTAVQISTHAPCTVILVQAKKGKE